MNAFRPFTLKEFGELCELEQGSTSIGNAMIAREEAGLLVESDQQYRTRIGRMAVAKRRPGTVGSTKVRKGSTSVRKLKASAKRPAVRRKLSKA